MGNLKSTSVKNLDKRSSERSWDVRVAQMTGNLNAALLYGQIAHHHQHMGEFSKSDQELSQELNLITITLKRMKSLLIEQGLISIHIGGKNKTIYSNVKKLNYCKKSYRRYNINYGIINNDTNAGILLSHLIYCNKHFLKKGHDEFFKSNENLVKEIYLSQWQLNEAKKKLVTNGFIVTRIGQYGRTYYRIKINTIEEAVSSIKTNCAQYQESAVLLEKTTIIQKVNDINESSIKTKTLAVSKPRTRPYQNHERDRIKTKRIIYNKDINNNYLTKAPIEKGEITHDSGLVSQLVKKENSRVEHPEIKPSHSEMHREVTEMPSIGVGVPSIKNTQERSVETPKEDADTNQLEKKGLKKMEYSFEEILEVKDNIEEMVKIWNDTIVKDKVTYNSLVPFLKEHLRKVLEEKFNDSLDLWKKYCTRLSKDDYRMGKIPGANGDHFFINLSWATKDETISNTLFVMDALNEKNNGAKNITPTLEILIKDILASSEDDWVKRLKIVMADYLYRERSHDGLRSFQSYLKTATFEKHETNGKKELIIRAPYNGYIGLFIYNDLITKACQDFHAVTIFDPSSREGNSLYMERKSTNVEEPSDVLNGICEKYGIPMSVLMQTSADEFNTNRTCEGFNP